MRRSLFVAITSVVLVAAAGGVASAHPLGNFTINHYAGVTVRPDSVIVDYVIDMAEIPAFQETPTIDRPPPPRVRRNNRTPDAVC